MAHLATRCNICIVLLMLALFIGTSLSFYSIKPSYLHRKGQKLSMEIFEGNPIGKYIWDQTWKLSLLQPGMWDSIEALLVRVIML